MKSVSIIADYRREDGTGWQVAVKDGYRVHREWAKPFHGFDPQTMRPIYGPEPATPGKWLYNVTGFTRRADWPMHPMDDCNVGHVETHDGRSQPVRMYGRKLFVTPRGTEAWMH